MHESISSNDYCRTVLNGNGKLPWELELAAEHGVLVNIDSEFDLANIAAAGKAVGKPVRTLVRINPDVDPQVSHCRVAACCVTGIQFNVQVLVHHLMHECSLPIG